MEELLRPSGLLLFCLVQMVTSMGAFPTEVRAQQTVSLKAVVIDASNEPGGIDPKLGNLAGELQRLPYSTYRLLETPQGSAALNQTWKTGVPDNRSLEVTPTAIQGGQYSLRIRVLGPGGQTLVNTEVRLRGGSPFLVAVPTGQKRALLIAISAG